MDKRIAKLKHHSNQNDNNIKNENDSKETIVLLYVDGYSNNIE